MASTHHWWHRSNQPEPYWLEITDRSDVGRNLWAPQANEDGSSYWSYTLVTLVQRDDVVFHYHKDSQAITGCSRALGTLTQQEIVWAAHGTSARDAGSRPRPRPGWRTELRDFRKLTRAVSLDALRQREDDIREVRDALLSRYGDPLYFPFELSDRRPLRPTQGYLTKLPADVVHLFAALASAARAHLGDEEKPTREQHGEEASPDELDALLELDAIQRVKVRREQAKIRSILFGGAKTATCALCGNDFPIDLLVAAHVKRRADCTPLEKRDFRNNVMAVCTFGCDELFERGYIVVRNGRIADGPQQPQTSTVQTRVSFLRGKSCSHWNQNRSAYFTWHRDHVLDRDG